MDAKGCLAPGAVTRSPPGLSPAPPLYLSQPVSQSLDHDAAIVVTLLLIGLAQLLHPEAGDGEQTQVVTDAGMQRSNEVREALVRVRAGRVLLGLQTQQTHRQTVSTDVGATRNRQQPRLFRRI